MSVVGLMRLFLSNEVGVPVSFRYETVDGTAVENRDFLSASDSVVFESGERSADIRVEILGDEIHELDEVFRISFSGGLEGLEFPELVDITILDNDAPTLSIDAASVLEGGEVGASSFLSFPVHLSRPSPLPISIEYSTFDGTATAPSDYQSAVDVLSIPPGDTSARIDVAVVGDAVMEEDETVNLRVDNATNLSVSVLVIQALGVILNDDVESGTVSPGDPGGGTGAVSYTHLTLPTTPYV